MTPRPIDLKRQQVRDDFCRDDYRTQEEVAELARTPHDERVKARLDARDAEKAKQEDKP